MRQTPKLSRSSSVQPEMTTDCKNCKSRASSDGSRTLRLRVLTTQSATPKDHKLVSRSLVESVSLHKPASCSGTRRRREGESTWVEEGDPTTKEAVGSGQNDGKTLPRGHLTKENKKPPK